MPARRPPREVVRWTTRRGGANPPTTLVVLHESVGITNAWDLALFCERRGVSYHDIADLTQMVHTVPFDRIGWHLRKANPRAVGLCLTTPVRAYSRGEWLGAQRAKVDYASWWVARACHILGVPIRHLSHAQIRAAVRGDHSAAGVCTHEDYTRATTDGTHVDPRNFPVDVCIDQTLEAAGQPSGVVELEERRVSWVPYRVHGEGWANFPISVGEPSIVIESAWISVIVDGPDPGRYEIWFQDDNSGMPNGYKVANIGFRDGRSDRKWFLIPNGTTQVRILHKLRQGGALSFEVRDKP